MWGDRTEPVIDSNFGTNKSEFLILVCIKFDFNQKSEKWERIFRLLYVLIRYRLFFEKSSLVCYIFSKLEER